MVKNKIVRVYDCRKDPLSDLNKAFDDGWILKLVTPRNGHTDYILAREETPKTKGEKIGSGPVPYEDLEKITTKRISYRDFHTSYGRLRGKRLDDVIFDSRKDAEEVLDQLADMIRDYGHVSVADLYDLAGISCCFADFRYGWTTTNEWIIKPYRLGYKVNLTIPKPLYENDRR